MRLWFKLLVLSLYFSCLDASSVRSLLEIPEIDPSLPPEQRQALIDTYQQAINRLLVLNIQMSVLYGAMFLLSTSLIAYLTHSQHNAFSGNTSAARKMILPAFIPLVWICAIVLGIYFVFFILIMSLELFDLRVHPAEAEGYSSGRNFIANLVMVYMLQKSVSRPALYRSCAIAFVLAFYPIPVLLYMQYSDVAPADQKVFQYCARGSLALFYVAVFIWPPERASKRVIREYCAFSTVYFISVFVYSELFAAGYTDAGITFVYVAVIWTIFYPVFIWRILKADTEHWRGLGQKACQLQKVLKQKRVVDERISSEGLHVMIEMHRKHIIDFAFVQFNKVIGKGSTAVVFEGLLRNRVPIAIKIYTPREVTEETVAEFSTEAALAGALTHPNIVKFFGMCVCPPNICLISELCIGSLETLISASLNIQTPTRKQLHINLMYMLDAARAVAYLHSFSPAFIHRDIKPENFLMDPYGVIKLSDFGESRILPRMAEEGLLEETNEFTSPTLSFHHDTKAIQTESTNSRTMTIRGTLEYLAPEMMEGRGGQAEYGAAADIYSLGITLWDILHPGQEKYGSTKNNLHVYDAVLNGERPPLGDHLHPVLKDLIESSWAQDPFLRPSAKDIVSILQDLQQELMLELGLQIAHTMPLHSKKTWKGKLLENVVSGNEAVAHILGTGFVYSKPEALRLGNALMDAHILHHCKHSRWFEQSNALYLFDEELLFKDTNEDQPVATILYEQPSEDQTKAVASEPRRKSAYEILESLRSRSVSEASSKAFGGSRPICNCSRLGQGFDAAKHYHQISKKKKQKSRNVDYLTTQLLPQESEVDVELDTF